MALIYCPECGRHVSDQAKHCINCGYPIAKPKGSLIIRAKRHSDPTVKHVYFLYANGVLFDEILPGEVKRYNVTQPFQIVLGHKIGSLICAGVKNSDPINVYPDRTTRLEASISQGLFKKYLLSEVDIIDSAE